MHLLRCTPPRLRAGARLGRGLGLTALDERAGLARS